MATRATSTPLPAPTSGRTARTGLPFVGIRRLGLWLAGAAWTSLILMWVTGSAARFGHDQEGTSVTLALGLFLIGWIVMVAAMMLPSTLSTLRRLDHVLADETRAAAPRFMFGFFLAWTLFGAAAFVGDGILHMLVASMPWLAERPVLIVGGVAMFAGVAELLGRTAPPEFPTVPPERGPVSLGKAHAVDRIRRCWPLMLFAMAIGMSSPVWMVGMTLVMTLELRPGATVALRLVGVLLFAVGTAVVVEPDWMPVLFGPG